ncbi:MAG: S8 family serine peptidase [Bacteroidota bacterium]
MDYITSMIKCGYKNFIIILLSAASFVSYGQSKQQREWIKQQFSSSEIMALKQEFEKEYTINKAYLQKLTRSKGLTASKELSNGNFMEIQDVGLDGTPIYYTTLNDNVSQTTRADALYSNGALDLGINGEDMLVGVWDAGIARTEHQEFDNRVTMADENREVGLHATRVMGTLIASGMKKKAKGVAFAASALTSDWSRDKIEVAEAAANGLLLSNHSYGIKSDRVPYWYFGSYLRVTQDWDRLMFNAPYYLMVTAAGNSQRLGHNLEPIYADYSKGYDLILGFAATKNGITVAAANTKIDRQGNLLEATVASYSSFGPTDDGRIKPDVAGTGSNIFTTHSKDNKSYGESSGTSMAAPGVTGSMLLLQQYYERLNKTFMKAATLKGLVLHTADDVDQPGPDYKMGWGVMNSKKAAEIIVNMEYKSMVSEETLDEGETYTITVNTDGTEPLMASISWTDPASEAINKGALNDPTPALTNDLDIRISKEGETYYPWKLSALHATNPAVKGDNRVDPFEKVVLSDPTSGTYTITVSHKGSLRNRLQDFSIIVSGINITECDIAIPAETTLAAANETSVLLSWEPVKDASFEVRYKEENAGEWKTLVTSENTIILAELIPETRYQIQLRTRCSQNITSEFTSQMAFEFMGTATNLDGLSYYTTLTTTSDINFSVYPNPAIERIQLDGNGYANNTEYRIVNTSGVTVKKGFLANNIVDVADLSTGLYIISIYDLNGIKSTKFCKY